MLSNQHDPIDAYSSTSPQASRFVAKLQLASHLDHLAHRRELRDIAAEYCLELPPDMPMLPTKWTSQSFLNLNWWFYVQHAKRFWPSAHTPLTLGLTREELFHDAARAHPCALPARFNNLEIGFMKSIVHAHQASHKDSVKHADKLRFIARNLGLRIDYE